MLKKCLADPALIVPTDSIGVKESISYEKIPVQILYRQVHKLRTKEVVSISLVEPLISSKVVTWACPSEGKFKCNSDGTFKHMLGVSSIAFLYPESLWELRLYIDKEGRVKLGTRGRSESLGSKFDLLHQSQYFFVDFGN
ncbi:hypothetical protein MTR67_043170 [Solanum verrucosum]|uniref:Uncharacterized protein n=1 Tax=Solanum verrucosum TaxID=315347 RepID=A0AAF0UPS7_SOLVR|nr:hypothetical protein MTR67_043170 [Solanum verrucosum]